MGKMTFPIDTMEPGEIPAFERIFEKFPEDPSYISLMLRYLVYRFDPLHAEMRTEASQEGKQALAERLSGWSRPSPESEVLENGDIKWSDGWEQYVQVERMFFELVDDFDFKYIVSLEIAMDNCNAVIRSPIPAKLSAEEKGKTMIALQKAIEGNNEARAIRRKIIAEMADGDEAAKANIAIATKGKRNPIAPEGIGK